MGKIMQKDQIDEKKYADLPEEKVRATIPFGRGKKDAEPSKEKPKKGEKKSPRDIYDKKNKKAKSKGSDGAEKKNEKTKGLSIKKLSGMLFAKMMKGGASELRANVEKVNKLNVFPVPDGDTGDNMSMTIDSGVAAIGQMESDDLAQVMKAVAKGMLMGARGNSGVILSQFFAGISEKLSDAENADAAAMADALEAGVERAYASVVTPTEGTILTVARESVDYARSRINKSSTVKTLFQDLVKEMHDAVERTPERLKVLKEAGVVDSGGAGLFYIIDGLNRVLGGEEINDSRSTPAPTTSAVSYDSFDPDSEMTYGYCTELMVKLQKSKCDVDRFDIDALKSFLCELGDSVVAFVTDGLVKLHVHTLVPEKVLAHVHTFGEFISVKIENMSLQHTALSEQDGDTEISVAKEMPAPVSKTRNAVALIAVSSGEGLDEIFKELGADEIVKGGQTCNPSTGDFIEAFRKVNAEQILLFPNNSNIVMAASQAAGMYSESKVRVIPTKSMGQGYAALSTIDKSIQSPDEMEAEAVNAIKSVSSAYISPSVRDTEINGIHVDLGDHIGVIDGRLEISAHGKMEATKALVDKLVEDKFLLTVFYGKDATEQDRLELDGYLGERYPNVERYMLSGEQDIYPFIFVCE